jgi:hypothetical protein
MTPAVKYGQIIEYIPGKYTGFKLTASHPLVAYCNGYTSSSNFHCTFSMSIQAESHALYIALLAGVAISC